MAKHKVEMTQAKRKVHYKDVEFEVYADNAKLGTLMISQGGVEWKGPYAKTASVISMGWEEFIKMLQKSQ